MKVLVIDDHFLIRDALRHVLAELDNAVCVLEASGCGEAMQLIESQPDLDLILLDLGLNDRDGFSLLSELRQSYPAISIVVLSASDDRKNVERALELGALGFIPKTTGRDLMLRALQLVFAGGIYIPTEILGRADRTLQPNEQPSLAGLRQISTTELGLTERQIDVLALMMQGKSNKAISSTLEIAEQTVKNHISAIFKSLRATNRTEAVVKVGKLEAKLKPKTKS